MQLSEVMRSVASPQQIGETYLLSYEEGTGWDIFEKTWDQQLGWKASSTQLFTVTVQLNFEEASQDLRDRMISLWEKTYPDKPCPLLQAPIPLEKKGFAAVGWSLCCIPIPFGRKQTETYLLKRIIGDFECSSTLSRNFRQWSRPYHSDKSSCPNREKAFKFVSELVQKVRLENDWK